jgi:hypothetical protein
VRHHPSQAQGAPDRSTLATQVSGAIHAAEVTPGPPDNLLAPVLLVPVSCTTNRGCNLAREHQHSLSFHITEHCITATSLTSFPRGERDLHARRFQPPNSAKSYLQQAQLTCRARVRHLSRRDPKSRHVTRHLNRLVLPL